MILAGDDSNRLLLLDMASHVQDSTLQFLDDTRVHCSSWGGLQMVDDPIAADVIARVATSIQERLLDAREAPASQVLEALADALTSLEYYIEGVGRREDRNVDLLKLAQSSLDDVGL